MGLLFTGSFFLSEFCLLRLELFATKTLKGGKDHEKQLKQLKRLKAWNLLSLHFPGKDPPNPTHCPFFFFFLVLVSNVVGEQTTHIWDFPKVTGGRGKKNIFESPDAEYPASVGLRLARVHNGPGLRAHFLPRAHTVVAFLGFFSSCEATGAYSLGLLTSYYGLPMPEDRLGRGAGRGSGVERGGTLQSAAQDRGDAVGLWCLGSVGLTRGTAARGCVQGLLT